MLLSQNLITKNNVNSYNTSVTQINHMQRNEAAVVSNMVKRSEDKLAALENKVELIKNTIAAANRQLYICESLLKVWS